MSDSDLGLGSPESGSPEGLDSPEERQKTVKNVQLSRYPPSHVSKEVLFGRIPAFLDISPEPFDQDDLESFEQIQNPNTVRWKYGRNEKGDMDKLSNARVIEWDDGSKTLQVGDEQFELRYQKPKEPVFITVDNSGLYDTTNLVDENVTIIPTSTASETHKRLAADLAARVDSKQVHVSAHATTDDPEQIQRNTIQAESAKEKARRKLDQKRDQESIPTSYASRNRSDDEEEEEEEDDEEEEEEAELSDVEESDSDEEKSNRLQAIKRKNEEEGESTSRRRKLVDDDSD